jgi:hypothetical protein
LARKALTRYARADDGDGWVGELVAVIQEIQHDFAPAQPWNVFFDVHAIRTMDGRYFTPAGSAT